MSRKDLKKASDGLDLRCYETGKGNTVKEWMLPIEIDEKKEKIPDDVYIKIPPMQRGQAGVWMDYHELMEQVWGQWDESWESDDEEKNQGKSKKIKNKNLDFY